MAKIHGVAGEWARVRGAVRGLWPLFVGTGACGFFVAVTFFASAAIGAVGVVLSLVSMGWCYVRGLRCVERFYKGALGEERVAGILKLLADDYHVFNDFVAGGEHVDHVIVGPAGVFAVETKFWQGRVTIEDGHILVNGALPTRSPLAQVRREADRVRTALAKIGWEGDVTPVLAFASDTFAHRMAELNGAVIINACELSGAFSTKRVVISGDECDRIVKLMENNR